MIMDIEFFLDGTKVNPVNGEELAISLKYDDDEVEAQVSTASWRFANEDAVLINSKIAAGMTGGFGIFQSPLFEIKLTDGNTTNVFKQYLELNAKEAKYSCGQVEVPAREYGQIDWLNDVADSVTFEHLASDEIGLITDADYISVPYVLLDELDRGWYKDFFLTTFSIIYTVQAINQQITLISSHVAGLVGVFNAPGDLIKLAFYVLYLVTLIIALVQFIKDLIALIIQPIKYHKGMLYKTLCEKACAHFNLTFQSSILQDHEYYKDLFHLPKKFVTPKDPDKPEILGFLQPNADQTGFYDGTFGQLLRELKDTFNAKVILLGDTLLLERVDYQIGTSAYIIPPELIEFKGYNAHECISNYVLKFQVDQGDNNTVREYKGTIVQAQLIPNTFSDKKLIQLKGLHTVSIPCARAMRKEKLTGIEMLLKLGLEIVEFALNICVDVGNAVIDAINTVGDFVEKIGQVLDFFGIDNNIEIPDIDPIPPVNLTGFLDDRIGMLVLQNDTVAVPKMYIIIIGNSPRYTKVHPLNYLVVGARYLYDHFHKINSFAPDNISGNPLGNQWELEEVPKCVLTYQDFELIKNNSRVYNNAGQVCKIDELEWLPWDCNANIKYRVNKTYTLNLIELINEGEGF